MDAILVVGNGRYGSSFGIRTKGLLLPSICVNIVLFSSICGNIVLFSTHRGVTSKSLVNKPIVLLSSNMYTDE